MRVQKVEGVVILGLIADREISEFNENDLLMHKVRDPVQ